MSQLTDVPSREISLKLSASASRALTALMHTDFNCFDSEVDVLSQAITLVCWSALEVRGGADLGSIHGHAETYTRLTMPFIARLAGAAEAVSQEASQEAPGEPLCITLPGGYLEAAERLLGLTSVKVFGDLDDLVSQAILLLLYAVRARLKGDYFGSVNEKSKRVRQVVLPFVDRLNAAA